MAKSTSIIAFDQHAATVTAAVLLPGQQTAAVHVVTADLPTVGRLVARVQGGGSRPAGAAGPRALPGSGRPAPVLSRH